MPKLDKLGLVKSRRGGRKFSTLKHDAPPTHGGDQVNYLAGVHDPAKLEARPMFLPPILRQCHALSTASKLHLRSSPSGSISD